MNKQENNIQTTKITYICGSCKSRMNIKKKVGKETKYFCPKCKVWS